METGEPLGVLLGHSEPIHDLISLAGEFGIVSISEDRSIRGWQAVSEASLVLRGHESWVTSHAFHPDGKTIVSASHDGELRRWNVAKGTLVERIPTGAALDCVVYGPQNRIAFANGQRSVSIGVPLANTEWSSLWLRDTFPRSLSWHAETDRVFARDSEAGVWVWDSAVTKALFYGQEKTFDKTAAYQAYSLAVHPDGERFATGNVEGQVSLWTIGESQARILTTVPGAVTALAFDPTGERLAIASDEPSIILHELEGVEEEPEVLRGHERRITCLAFSPNGTRLVSGSQDGSLRVWDAQLAVTLLTLRGHRQAVTQATFSPDGTQLASSSKDGTLRLWRTKKTPKQDP